MGRREEDKMERWKLCWPSTKIGRYWKRQLSKARRRYIKQTLKGIKAKESTNYESTVNYKTW